MGFCHLSYLGQNTLFPALNSHLQLILELVIVLCVASTLSAIPDSRTKQFFCFLKMLRGLNPHPASPKHCPSLCDTGTMSSQCVDVFPVRFCLQQLLDLCQRTSPSGPGTARHKEPAKLGRHHRTQSWSPVCCQIS